MIATDPSTWQTQLRRYQRALAQTREPAGKAETLVRMGLLAFQHQAYEQAEFYYRQSYDLVPSAAVCLHLGQLAVQKCQFARAETFYQQAMVLQPRQAAIWVHLGILQLQGQKLDLAEASLQQALELEPGHPQALLNLSQVYAVRQHWELAESLLQQVLHQDPHSPVALGNLGQLYIDRGLPAQALVFLQKAVEIWPRARSYSQLGAAFHQMGQPEKALPCFAKACALDPTDLQASAHLLNCQLNLMPWQPIRLFKDFQAWGDRLIQQVGPIQHDPEASQASFPKMRVGYLSGDFREHSAARVYEWLLMHHDRNRFEIFAYANLACPDPLSQRFASLVDHWQLVAGLCDQDLADQIRQDGIQILVDLSGHTALNRLGVMARKPAPVQVTGLGHVFTTGLRTIDYRLSDAVCSPSSEASLSPEKICFLPSWLCWMPPQAEPPEEPLPAGLADRLVLGSCNHPFKMNALVFDCWSEILQRLPEAVLLLMAKPFRDPQVQALFQNCFQQRGIAPERLYLLADKPYQEYLALYRHIHLGLDPFPYGGGLTTCDALWMNTPVLTLDDGSRGSASILRQIDAVDCLAVDLADYCEKAVKLLRQPRQNLRKKLLAAQVCQGSGFARALEANYLEMWQKFKMVAA